MNRQLYNEIKESLLPLVATKEERQTLVLEAFHGSAILNLIELEGTPEDFASRLADLLSKPEFEDELAALLETVRKKRGVNHDQKISTLVQKVEEQKPQNPVKKWLYKNARFINALLSLSAAGMILAFSSLTISLEDIAKLSIIVSTFLVISYFFGLIKDVKRILWLGYLYRIEGTIVLFIFNGSLFFSLFPSAFIVTQIQNPDLTPYPTVIYLSPTPRPSPTAIFPSPTPRPSPTFTPIPESLSISVRPDPPFVVPGEEIRWSIDVTNNTNINIDDIRITNEFTGDLIVASPHVSRGTADYVEVRQLTIWNLGTLKSGQFASLTIQTRVREGTQVRTFTSLAKLSSAYGGIKEATGTLAIVSQLPATGGGGGGEIDLDWMLTVSLILSLLGIAVALINILRERGRNTSLK